MIVITSIDGNMDGRLDERFGRAGKIIIYDPGKKDYRVIDNNINMNASEGAGIQTAQNIIDAGAKVVLTGHLGPNAYRVLVSAGIEAYSASDLSCREALKAYEESRLEKLTGADVKGHW